MITVTHRPKKGAHRSATSRIQFCRWEASSKKYTFFGELLWDGYEWKATGPTDTNRLSMQCLANTKRSFGGKVYTKRDHEFFKPFYFMPTTGTKVKVL